jgi:hypothetical protein
MVDVVDVALEPELGGVHAQDHQPLRRILIVPCAEIGKLA